MTPQATLDDMLRVAAWEVVFGHGSPATWKPIIDGLIARGARWRAE